MTGGEFIAGAAASKAAIEVAKTAAKDRQVMRQALLEEAKKTPGFARAAQSFGQREAVKQQIALILYKPLASVMGLSRDYFEDDFSRDMADRIDQIPAEHQRTPRASIAGPAMEGLAYSLDEPDLKELYLTLLTNASDDRSAEATHPAFVTILRQITSEEARLLKLILANVQNKPMTQIRVVFEPAESYSVLTTHILGVRDESGEPIAGLFIARYVENWARLGLVTVSYEATLSGQAYEWIDEHPDVQQAHHLHSVTPFEPTPTATGRKIETPHGILSVTEFGRAFAESVGMSEGVAE